MIYTPETQTVDFGATLPPPAAVFRRWLGEGLVWLPERGMGYLPVTDAPYDVAYFEKYERYAATDLGRAITEARLRLVEQWAGRCDLIDVGIGCGAFVEARGRNTWGYDVNPAGVTWLHHRGLWRDPHREPADALTFWDSIEHIPDPAPMLAHARRWVFASLPIVPGDGPPSPAWRHYRTDEHCWYWTRRGFVAWMREHGFECVEHNTAESLLGREDIESFAFRRVG